MIIGTAGHIDHGKTTLVRALTGVDTDRLKEEKARGISIELGYAYTPLPDGEVLGIIDVPGHEKFVHTMAAGAVGIDHALLVVAADDGVMPQTREHLAIVGLLGVTQGTVALTKADRAAPARVAQVRAEIHALLAGTPLAGAPIFDTAATQPGDPGVTALREHLLARAQALRARRADGLLRLAVDRVFTLPGQGTVVTGTVFGGTVRVGDTVQHSGTGQPVRVRSIHAQNRDSATGRAGQRCALNLAGIERGAIARGDWIADTRALQATRRIDVRLKLLPGASGPAPVLAQPLTQWATVHVHLGTAHHMAHVALLAGDALAPGSEARVQLVFDAGVFATAGDRLIVRNAQANRTIGGGMVLDPCAPERKRRSAERMAWLDALEAALAGGGLGPLVERAPYGMARARLALLLGLPPEALDLPADLVALPHPGGDMLLLAPARRAQLQAQVLAALARLHERSPDEPGVNAARLRRMALPGLAAADHDALWDGLLAALLESGAIARSGAWLHLPEHRVVLSAAEQALAERLLPALHGTSSAEGFDPPWVRDLARDHQAGEDAVRQLLHKLARQGALFQVVKDLFYADARIAELAAIAARLATEAPRGQTANAPSGAVEAARFRDATGLGRKRAIQVLEFFDRVGYTRRVRDAHVLRPGAAWGAGGA
ncbi:selenocysteine-specific translation elongation factor [Ramlibacter sp. H39-3-26]|uniref:selenocysteine-specific translation elongation factor n=1 Tax=Curvibacter soli TaxID=3031331 RepID=UPI0023D9E76B|nr:selenocysteine-specific translation elongation factor [Ramlibacter sp. H39-3-26]MDF1485120.1 selenocysteine-specific translation elongation factor [Ramlibacter sp. H39-3-26]